MFRFQLITYILLLALYCKTGLARTQERPSKKNRQKQIPQTPKKTILSEADSELFTILNPLENLFVNPAENNSSIQTIIAQALEHVCPQQKRVRELTERSALAQIEVQQRISTTDPTPILSFIIPCYNRAHCVLDAIESIYAQNLTVPFEVVVVDDCSTDNSFEILQACEKKYSNFYAYRNPQNKGAPTTRNNAIARARGKYICNADSDDIFKPDSIKPMIESMLSRGHSVVFFEKFIFFLDCPSNPCDIVASTPPNYLLDINKLLSGKYLSVASGNRLFTKESWLNSGGYIEAPGHDTWSFSFKLFANGYYGYIYPDSAYYAKMWRDHSNKWWSDHKNNVEDISPHIVLLEHPEIFTPESFQLIFQYIKNNNMGIIDYIQREFNRTIFSIPEKHLTNLLAAYQAEIKKDFSSALTLYLEVLSYPNAHPIVLIKATRAAMLTQQYTLAQKIITQLLH